MNDRICWIIIWSIAGAVVVNLGLLPLAAWWVRQ
jgi:hypothetical protein